MIDCDKSSGSRGIRISTGNWQLLPISRCNFLFDQVDLNETIHWLGWLNHFIYNDSIYLPLSYLIIQVRTIWRASNSIFVHLSLDLSSFVLSFYFTGLSVNWYALHVLTNLQWMRKSDSVNWTTRTTENNPGWYRMNTKNRFSWQNLDKTRIN